MGRRLGSCCNSRQSHQQTAWGPASSGRTLPCWLASRLAGMYCCVQGTCCEDGCVSACNKRREEWQTHKHRKPLRPPNRMCASPKPRHALTPAHRVVPDCVCAAVKVHPAPCCHLPLLGSRGTSSSTPAHPVRKAIVLAVLPRVGTPALRKVHASHNCKAKQAHQGRRCQPHQLCPHALCLASTAQLEWLHCGDEMEVQIDSVVACVQ
jgi:hypothetical protein